MHFNRKLVTLEKYTSPLQVRCPDWADIYVGSSSQSSRGPCWYNNWI